MTTDKPSISLAEIEKLERALNDALSIYRNDALDNETRAEAWSELSEWAQDNGAQLLTAARAGIAGGGPDTLPSVQDLHDIISDRIVCLSDGYFAGARSSAEAIHALLASRIPTSPLPAPGLVEEVERLLWEHIRCGDSYTFKSSQQKAARAIASLPSLSGGWRDIESAPKDGTKVLLRFAPPFNDVAETGVVTGIWTGRSWWLSSIWAASDAHREPTHWQPLPSDHAAPTAGGWRDGAEAMREALWGSDPEMPNGIRPLGWLSDAITELEERGPLDTDDPDSYWEMVREIRDLNKNARRALKMLPTPPLTASRCKEG